MHSGQSYQTVQLTVQKSSSPSTREFHRAPRQRLNAMMNRGFFFSLKRAANLIPQQRPLTPAPTEPGTISNLDENAI